MTHLTNRVDVWKPATQDDMVMAMSLLANLPARQTDNPHVDKAAYFIALEGVTCWGLTQAVKSILRGALVHTFFPTPPEIRRQCDLAMLPYQREIARALARKEQNQIDRSLAETRAHRTPEARKRVQDAYQRFLDASKHTDRDKEESDRTAILNKYGLTEESLAALPDQPSTFKRVGDRT